MEPVISSDIKMQAVAAIANGTVLDHIEPGAGIKIVKLLRLPGHRQQVTLGLNLPSKRMSFKDIIKVEGRELSPAEANQVAILAPLTTINIIQNYEITQKFQVALPERIADVISCPNPCCISNHEPTTRTIYVLSRAKNPIFLECHYCRKLFTHEEIR